MACGSEVLVAAWADMKRRVVKFLAARGANLSAFVESIVVYCFYVGRKVIYV